MVVMRNSVTWSLAIRNQGYGPIILSLRAKCLTADIRGKTAQWMGGACS